MLNKFFILLILFIFNISCSYALDNPVKILNDTVIKTQNDLITNSKEYEKNPYKLIQLINEKIIPIMAADVIAEIIVGSNKWRKAALKEQNDFVKSTVEMLTFMYAKNVTSVGDYKITLFNFDKSDDSWKEKPIVVINGTIKKINTNRSSNISIKMFQKNDKWLIYDFDIAGVSILHNYQKQFEPYANIEEMIKIANGTTYKIKKNNYPQLLK